MIADSNIEKIFKLKKKRAYRRCSNLPFLLEIQKENIKERLAEINIDKKNTMLFCDKRFDLHEHQGQVFDILDPENIFFQHENDEIIKAFLEKVQKSNVLIFVYDLYFYYNKKEIFQFILQYFKGCVITISLSPMILAKLNETLRKADMDKFKKVYPRIIHLYDIAEIGNFLFSLGLKSITLDRDNYNIEYVEARKFFHDLRDIGFTSPFNINKFPLGKEFIKENMIVNFEYFTSVAWKD